MGARPLRRTIEQYLEDPLAEKVLMNPNEGRRCAVTVEGDHLLITDKEVIPHFATKDKDSQPSEKATKLEVKNT